MENSPLKTIPFLSTFGGVFPHFSIIRQFSQVHSFGLVTLKLMNPKSLETSSISARLSFDKRIAHAMLNVLSKTHLVENMFVIVNHFQRCKKIMENTILWIKSENLVCFRIEK